MVLHFVGTKEMTIAVAGATKALEWIQNNNGCQGSKTPRNLSLTTICYCTRLPNHHYLEPTFSLWCWRQHQLLHPSVIWQCWPWWASIMSTVYWLVWSQDSACVAFCMSCRQDQLVSCCHRRTALCLQLSATKFRNWPLLCCFKQYSIATWNPSAIFNEWTS